MFDFMFMDDQKNVRVGNAMSRLPDQVTSSEVWEAYGGVGLTDLELCDSMLRGALTQWVNETGHHESMAAELMDLWMSERADRSI